MSHLDQLLSVLTQEHVFIQTHNYPDQDALACAKALQELLTYCGKPSTICYKGRIDKYNTLLMIESLHIDIFPIENIHMTKQDEIILVDCQKGNSNVKDFIGDEIACIDHHKKQRTDIYRYYDIRNNIGACSSIIATYFFENDIPITKEVATALVYGIKMDTLNLSRAVSDLDLDMFCQLYKLSNKQTLRKLDCCTLKVNDLTSYKKAIADLRIYRKIGLANIGNDCSEAMIGTISDFLLALEEIEFAIAYSYRNQGLKFSARSEDELLDAAYIIKQALDGYGDGGGHATMAAGFIPNLQTEEQALEVASIIEQRLLDILV